MQNSHRFWRIFLYSFRTDSHFRFISKNDIFRKNPSTNHDKFQHETWFINLTCRIFHLNICLKCTGNTFEESFFWILFPIERNLILSPLLWNVFPLYIYIDLILTRRKIKKNIDCFAIFNNPFWNRFTEIQFCKRMFLSLYNTCPEKPRFEMQICHFRTVIKFDITGKFILINAFFFVFIPCHYFDLHLNKSVSV
jgi:hypothetical protein